MDNIILGLLLMCNRTIYQLRDRISKGINLMYSSSMGSAAAYFAYYAFHKRDKD